MGLNEKECTDEIAGVALSCTGDPSLVEGFRENLVEVDIPRGGYVGENRSVTQLEIDLRRRRGDQSARDPALFTVGTRSFHVAGRVLVDKITLEVVPSLPTYLRVLPGPLFTQVHPAHMNRSDYLGSLMFTEIIDGLVQLLCRNRGISFLHAAAVERRDRRVALIAGGGLGKTGTMLELVTRRQWRYLADDWTAIRDDGVIFPSRRRIHVAPRNLENATLAADRLFISRTRLDRYAWKIMNGRLGRRGLSRHVHPDELSVQVGNDGPLTDVFVIRRDDVEQIVASPITPLTAAHYGAQLTERELVPSNGVVDVVMRAAPDLRPAKSVEEILAAALSDVVCSEVRIPRHLQESEIESWLLNTLDLCG